VQPYDGSGWGISNPEALFIRVDKTGTGVSAFLFQTGEEEVLRLFGVSAFTVVGPVSTIVCSVASQANEVVMIAPEETSPAVAAGSIPFDINRAMIMGPNVNLQVNQFGGGAGTVIRYTAYGFRAPIGTTFYC